VVDISSLISQAVSCTHSNSSISALFKSPFIKPVHTPLKAKDPSDGFTLEDSDEDQ
jgi:hypothetical protein